MIYIGKTLLRLILLLFCVSLFAFCLIEYSPIDPINAYLNSAYAVSPEQKAELAKYFGLDKSAYERFGTWIYNIFQLDFGFSTIYRIPVIEVIKDKALNSLLLMLFAWLLSGAFGLSLGIIMGVNAQNKWGKILKVICLSLCAIPTFLLGIIFLLIFSVWLDLFPIGFSVPIGVLAQDVSILQKIHHLILPALVLALSSFANIALHTREKMISVLQSDYILLAKTRTYSKNKIIIRHGLRNILLPAISLQFAYLNEIFGGSILAETVFSYPGLGSAIVEAGLKSDVALLLGIAIFSALFVFSGNLIANVLYGYIDPKIRLTK